MRKREPWIRRMGFLRDQDGIMNRYMREKAGWDPHLKRTRGFINGSLKDERINTVAVLGSGWLLDVPLEEMTTRFATIYLVDIRHPPQVRKRVENLNQVKLIDTDLTGGIMEQLWNVTRRHRRIEPDQILERLVFNPPLGELKPDALISVNLLNQLDSLPCEYLERSGHFQQHSLLRLRSWLQKAHLDWISKGPGCIITDTVEINRDRSGNESRKKLIYCDLPSGIRADSWKWAFDSKGTYRSGSLTHMEVQAVEWS
jgi:hypothetical protein